MSKLPGYENTVVCPYNKCHIILKSRIQTHLIKCAKQHPEIVLETCRFDVTHKFPAAERNSHEAECPSRENFDRYLYSVSTNNTNTGTASQSTTNTRRNPPPNYDDDDEDW
ncbi:gametocyte-specific factor 1-like [Contarinia nasturtii]|uniref:gametocyte-specific factor 1-like n=1 Tax=Contarinia nasturtii TaxID=265458 RepID=UPI0012D38731|nr:gametocyte-specific factor 1-like [Contarinia nasturtii]